MSTQTLRLFSQDLAPGLSGVSLLTGLLAKAAKLTRIPRGRGALQAFTSRAWVSPGQYVHMDRDSRAEMGLYEKPPLTRRDNRHDFWIP